MENKKLTMADFIKQIDKYLDSFKDYCETLDIDLFKDKFFLDPSNKELSPEREIKQELITYFLPKKDEIREYRYDYYSMKTASEIANNIEREESRVIAYLERIKHTFTHYDITKLSEFGDVTQNTKVKKISSFRILKDFQLKERQLILSSKVKERAHRNKLNNQ